MKLILFDIDGTLIHVGRETTHEAVRSVLHRLLGHEGEAPDHEFHGKTDRQIFMELAGVLGRHGEFDESMYAELDTALCEVWDRLLDADTVTVLPGVPELLERLAARGDVLLGLLTGNLESCARRKLEPHALNRYFPFGAYGSDAIDRVDLPPIALRRAGDIHGLRFESDCTLIVGDSHRDIACARAWGIRALAVATGSLTAEQLLDHAPDAVCDSLLDDSYIMEFLRST